jgi:gliding motility-associated-like protein
MCSEVVSDAAAYGADESGVYSVVISMPAPCVWTAEGAYEVVAEPCELTIPNVFSPNNLGDGNDAFRVDGLDGYPRSTVRIYDRWGSLVFSHDDFGNSAGWSPKPDEASEGTYFYVLGVARNESTLTVTNEEGELVDYDGTGMKYFNGTLTLVR